MSSVIVTTETELRALVFDAVKDAISKQSTSTGSTPLCKYLNAQEASKFLGKTANALRVMVCKHQIKSIKKNNRLYFREADLIEYLESGTQATRAELANNCEDALNIKGGKVL